MAEKFFKKFTIYKFNELVSTNEYASYQIKINKASHGDVYIAGFQSNGKGQAGNIWYSDEDKNILISLVCKEVNIDVSLIFYINMLVSLSLYDTLKVYLINENISIKWSNDILVNNKKIAGILIESSISGDYIKNIIIGIGINVNQDSFPENLPDACSFYTWTNKKFNIDEIIATLLDSLNSNLARIKKTEVQKIKAEYESKLFGINIIRYFRSKEKKFRGIIKGVNNYGQLEVLVDEKILTFNNKEIEFERSSN